MKKKTRQIVTWITLFIMVGGIVLSIVAYTLQ